MTKSWGSARSAFFFLNEFTCIGNYVLDLGNARDTGASAMGLFILFTKLLPKPGQRCRWYAMKGRAFTLRVNDGEDEKHWENGPRS